MKKLIYLISFILPLVGAAQSIKPGSLRIPEYSTTARNSANLRDSSIIINTDSAKMQFYLAGTWYTLAASSGGSSGAQTLSYGQYATADTMTISGGNKVALPTATSSVAGQLDTGRAKAIDSLRNRTITGFGISGLTPGYLQYATTSSSLGSSPWYYNSSTGESILSGPGGWASHFNKSNYIQLRQAYIALADSGSGVVGISTTSIYNSGVLNIAGTTSVNGSLYIMASGSNVGSLIGSGTTFYIDSRVASGGITFRTNNTTNTALQLLSSGTAQFFAPTVAAASVNFPGGATPTSPNDGDIWNNSSTHHLFVRLNGTTYQLDQQSGGGSQTLQQVFNVGGGGNQTLTKADTVTFSSATWKWFGLSHDTTSSFGLLGFKNDSSTAAFSWANITAEVSARLPIDTLKASNGLTITGPVPGTDTVQLGGSLTQNTTIGLGTNTLNLTGTGGGIINFFASLNYNYTSTGDANYTVTDGAPVYLLFASITANRTITLPSAGTAGRTIIFYNGNTGSFNWSFSSSISYPDGGTLTTLAKNTWYTIYAQAGTWYVLSTYARSQPLSYTHTIFTPTTGGTVALVNNQYNIINPASPIITGTVTLNLPSSPQNNDCVYIKFASNSVGTVAYSNGTVAGGILAPTVGTTVTLVYDSGTSTWY